MVSHHSAPCGKRTLCCSADNSVSSNLKRARSWHAPSTSLLNFSPPKTVSYFSIQSVLIRGFLRVASHGNRRVGSTVHKLTPNIGISVAGAKHKVKAAEKEEQRQASLAAQASSPATATAEPAKVSPTKEAGKKTPKDSTKKKEKASGDAAGNELKRPLSAYMLYNNHRRPTLRAEHPGKDKI